MRFRNLLLSLLLSAALAPAAVAQVKLEPAGPLKDASAEVGKALATEGHRVVLGNGDTLCEMWLATALPPAPSQDAEHTNYSAKLTPGELVGAIAFPHGAKDFRGQPIKAGTYTLRYELMPNDGNHMGVAPQRDFLLLVAMASDARTAPMNSSELLKASSDAAGSSHPAVFLLLPPKSPTLSPPKAAGEKDGPPNGGASAYESPEGFVVFAGKAGGVGLALVVKGQAEQ